MFEFVCVCVLFGVGVLITWPLLKSQVVQMWLDVLLTWED